MSPDRPWPARQRLLVLVVVGVVLVASTVALVYALTRPPNLAVTDGSITGAIQGNFTAFNSGNALVSHLNATTIANQSGYPSSTVTLLLRVVAYYDASSTAVRVDVTVTVLGRLATNLDPSGMTLTYTQTGTNISVTAIPGGVPTFPGYQAPENVSFDPTAGFSFGYGNGTSALSATLVGQTGDGPYYQFRYPAEIDTRGLPQYNHVISLRVDLIGLSVPVAVGIVLKVINTGGGIWA